MKLRYSLSLRCHLKKGPKTGPGPGPTVHFHFRTEDRDRIPFLVLDRGPGPTVQKKGPVPTSVDTFNAMLNNCNGEQQLKKGSQLN